jgi:hypothetical protein
VVRPARTFDGRRAAIIDGILSPALERARAAISSMTARQANYMINSQSIHPSAVALPTRS